MSAEENLKAVELRTQDYKETIEIGGSITQLAEKYNLDLKKFQEWLDRLNKHVKDSTGSFGLREYSKHTAEVVRAGIAEVMNYFLTSYLPKVYLPTGAETDLRNELAKVSPEHSMGKGNHALSADEQEVVQVRFYNMIRAANVAVNGLLNNEIKKAVSGDSEDLAEKIGKLPDESLVAMATDLVLYSGLTVDEIESPAFDFASFEGKSQAITTLYEQKKNIITAKKDAAITRYLKAGGCEDFVHEGGVNVASAR